MHSVGEVLLHSRQQAAPISLMKDGRASFLHRVCVVAAAVVSPVALTNFTTAHCRIPRGFFFATWQNNQSINLTESGSTSATISHKCDIKGALFAQRD